jgi:hypothetical protein
VAAEAGVIDKPNPTVGERAKAFVSLKDGFTPDEALRRELMGHARQKLGAAVAGVVNPFRTEVVWMAMFLIAGSFPTDGRRARRRLASTAGRLSHRHDPTIRRLQRGHRTDRRSLTHPTNTQPTEPLHAPIRLSPSHVDSAPISSGGRRSAGSARNAPRSS